MSVAQLIINNLIFLFCVICFVFKFVYMLQLNQYYFVDGLINYLKLLKNNIYAILYIIINTIIFILYNTLEHENINIYVMLCILLIYNIVFQIALCLKLFYKKNNTLRITNRVLRFICVSLFLSILFIFISNYFNIDIIYYYGIWYIFIVALCLISHLMTYSIEQLILKKYIKRAVIKLKQNNNLIIIGITGSYGKTTTKMFLQSILKTKYNVYHTPKSYNTLSGIVKSINDEKDFNKYDIAIIEMGADRNGDIDKILKYIKLDISIITSFGIQHLKHFKNLNNVINEKTKILSKNKYISNNIVNDKYIKYIDKNLYKCLKYNFIFNNIKFNKNQLSFELLYNNITYKCCSNLIGDYNIENIKMCVLCALKLNIDIKDIIASINKLHNIESRLHIIQNSDNKVIINSGFNSNLNTAKSNLKVLKKYKNYNKILITPGLIDLGKYQKYANYNYIDYICKSNFLDKIIIINCINKKVLIDRLKYNNYNLNNVAYFENFQKAYNVFIKNYKHKSVFLIENDVPDNIL